MRKRVIIGLSVLCLLFLLGDIFSVLLLRHTTSELTNLIEPHESEMMRQDLVIASSQLQTDLALFDADQPFDVGKVSGHIEELRRATNVCLSCHHSPPITTEQNRIKNLVGEYEQAITRLVLSSRETSNQLRKEAIKIGQSINDRTFKISKLANDYMQTREEEIMERTRHSWMIVLATLLVAVLVAFYFAYSFSQKLISPMDTLLTATKRIASGDLGFRAKIHSKDEFAELAESFNTMSENLQRSYETISLSNIEVRETRDYLAALISSMDDSIVVIDKDYRITDANPAFFKLIGLPEESVKNKKTDEISFKLKHKEIFPLADHPITEVFKTGRSTRAINSQLISTGEEKIFEITASPILAHGSVDKVLEVIRDITERVEMEKAILLRDKELKETQEKMVSSERLRALGEMAAGIAHGFNNILSGILGNIQNLLEETKDPEIKNMLKLIENSTIDGAEIVRRIQEFSRVRRGGVYTEININEIIEDTMKITESKWKNEAATWGIRFDFDMDLGDSPPLYGNPAELREALTNIFLNAFEAMPEGGKIYVSTRNVDNSAEVIIEDTGKGMDEQTVKKIFDPFFTTKGVKGTGLGLSITYGIVTRHEGEIEVTSRPYKGTQFKITLPIKEPVVTQKEILSSGSTHLGRVLVIDDEPMILHALETMLKRAGHEVTCRPDGESGLKAIDEEEFDIVITDLGMQDFSGWEITKALSINKPKTRIIMLTGWGFQLDAAQTKDAGVDILISKPFTKKQVLESINRLLIEQHEEDKPSRS